MAAKQEGKENQVNAQPESTEPEKKPKVDTEKIILAHVGFSVGSGAIPVPLVDIVP